MKNKANLFIATDMEDQKHLVSAIQTLGVEEVVSTISIHHLPEA